MALDRSLAMVHTCASRRLDLELLTATGESLGRSSRQSADESLVLTAEESGDVLVRVSVHPAKPGDALYYLKLTLNPTCLADEDCTIPGEICLHHACQPGCVSNDECPEGDVCLVTHRCGEPECRDHDDCADGEACIDDICQSTICVDDADCERYGLVCNVEEGYCVRSQCLE